MANKFKLQTTTAIRKSLMEQLESRGADISLYKDIVDQYIKNIDLIRQFQADIELRGVYDAVAMKDNPSIRNLLATQKQNTALLKSMELSTTKCVVDDDEL